MSAPAVGEAVRPGGPEAAMPADQDFQNLEHFMAEAAAQGAAPGATPEGPGAAPADPPTETIRPEADQTSVVTPQESGPPAATPMPEHNAQQRAARADTEQIDGRHARPETETDRQNAQAAEDARQRQRRHDALREPPTRDPAPNETTVRSHNPDGTFGPAISKKEYVERLLAMEAADDMPTGRHNTPDSSQEADSPQPADPPTETIPVVSPDATTETIPITPEDIAAQAAQANKAAEQARQERYAEGKHITVQELMKADDIHKLEEPAPAAEAPVQGPKTLEESIAHAQENPDEVTKEELQSLLEIAAQKLKQNAEATTETFPVQDGGQEQAEKKETPAEAGEKVAEQIVGEVSALGPDEAVPPAAGRASRIWNKAKEAGSAMVDRAKSAVQIEAAGQKLSVGHSLIARAYARATFARDSAQGEGDYNFTHATHNRYVHNRLYGNLLEPGVREHLETHDPRMKQYNAGELPSNESVRERVMILAKREAIAAVALAGAIPTAVAEVGRIYVKPNSESFFNGGVPGARQMNAALESSAADTPARKRLEQVQIHNEVQARMAPHNEYLDRQEELQRARHAQMEAQSPGSTDNMIAPGHLRRQAAEQFRQEVADARKR